MTQTLAAFDVPTCPYCGEPAQHVSHTLSNGNLTQPYHIGPARRCRAFDHWAPTWDALRQDERSQRVNDAGSVPVEAHDPERDDRDDA